MLLNRQKVELSPFQEYQRRKRQAAIGMRVVWSLVLIGLVVIMFGGGPA